MKIEDAFGKPTVYDPNGSIRNVSQYGNRFMFTGREYDAETGNYYYRARYYSPETGRFLSPDPIGYYGRLNLYTYCINNPINYSDPYGKIPQMSPEACDDLYRQRTKGTLERENQCHKECGISPVGLGTVGCAALAAMAGPFAEAVFAVCETTQGFITVACHYMCSEISKNEGKSARNARNRCLDKCP